MCILQRVHFIDVLQKQTVALHAIIEVKAEERKKPNFMARRQNAGQYHDLKAVNTFSEV